MWVTLFGPLGERLIAQAYSQTCPSKVAPARHREEWFGVCDYNLHWWGGGCFFSEVQPHCWPGWWGWKIVSICTHPQGEEFGGHHCSGDPHKQQTIFPPMSQAFVRSLRSTCLCLGHQIAQYHSSVFISGPWLGFKTPNMKDLTTCRPISLPHKSLTALHLTPSCPRKAIS